PEKPGKMKSQRFSSPLIVRPLTVVAIDVFDVRNFHEGLSFGFRKAHASIVARGARSNKSQSAWSIARKWRVSERPRCVAICFGLCYSSARGYLQDPEVDHGQDGKQGS